MDGMTIGQLAAHTGLSISAVRFYQRRGLLPARQPNGGWQRFGSDSLARLTVIKLAKDCGFTLDEIAVLLDALYAPTSPTATWQAMGRPPPEDAPAAHRGPVLLPSGSGPQPDHGDRPRLG
jgi:MerR family redox-sensitive transcriptional activator SoxR